MLKDGITAISSALQSREQERKMCVCAAERIAAGLTVEIHNTEEHVVRVKQSSNYGLKLVCVCVCCCTAVSLISFL